MTKENIKRLHAIIIQQGTLIQNSLPSLDSHPNGRIGIAHIYSVIKEVMGVPMKECRDCRVDDILEIIQYVVDNAKEDSIMDNLKKYEKEPIYETVTLDNFF